MIVRKLFSMINEIELTVDYAKTIEQVIADGKYDWKHEDITIKNFPISPKGIKEKEHLSAKLFQFTCDVSFDYVVREMDRAGYRPATLMELLVFGMLFHEPQNTLSIVALGSIWNGAYARCYVPCIENMNSKRGLSLACFAFRLGWFDQKCDTSHRFLGIRK